MLEARPRIELGYTDLQSGIEFPQPAVLKEFTSGCAVDRDADLAVRTSRTGARQLAADLLAFAETAPDPRPLIAAARVLLATRCDSNATV
jgi:hypothetical protein